MGDDFMGRKFVIADIHGCCRTFQELIFSTLKLTKADSLFLLGDYIDRGPDSRGVIETIINLIESGYAVYPLLGNHEQMLLDAATDIGAYNWLCEGGQETLRSYGTKCIKEIPVRHLNFLQSLSVMHLIDTHVFVHAGLDFNLNNPLIESSVFSKLWSRNYCKVSPQTIGGRKIVSGHTIHSLRQVRQSLKTNWIRLDNGCFLGSSEKCTGNLVALELNAGELFVQRSVE